MLNYTPGRNIWLNLYKQYEELYGERDDVRVILSRHHYKKDDNIYYTRCYSTTDGILEYNGKKYLKLKKGATRDYDDMAQLAEFSDATDSCVLSFNVFAENQNARFVAYYYYSGQSQIIECSHENTIQTPSTSWGDGSIAHNVTTTPTEYYVKWRSRDSHTGGQNKRLIMARIYDPGYVYIGVESMVTLGEELYDYRPAPEDVNTVVCDISTDSFTL